MKKITFLITFIFLISFIQAECLENQININSATSQELQTLTGIGPTYAERIISSRPFNSLEELTKVNGIGPVTVEKIKQQGLACPINSQTQEIQQESNQETTIEQQDKTPQKININTAIAEELTLLDGIGPTYAERIIKQRQIEHFCTLKQLENIKGIGPATISKIKAQDLAYIETCEQETLENSTETFEETPEQKTTQKNKIILEKETENIIKLDKQETPEQLMTGKVIYQSKTEKIKKYAIYAFSIFLIGIIFLIIKK